MDLVYSLEKGTVKSLVNHGRAFNKLKRQLFASRFVGDQNGDKNGTKHFPEKQAAEEHDAINAYLKQLSLC